MQQQSPPLAQTADACRDVRRVDKTKPSRTPLSGLVLWKKWLKDVKTTLATESLYTQRSRGRTAQSFLIFTSHKILFSFVFCKKSFETFESFRSSPKSVFGGIMRHIWALCIALICISCVPKRAAQNSEVMQGKTLSGVEVTFCDEIQLNSCVSSNGGAGCLTNHCDKKTFHDNVCATSEFRNCLANGGGIGCKKYCGHPVQCLRKSAVFDCGPGMCRCLDTGAAAPSPVGDTIIDLVSTAGISFAAQLLKNSVTSIWRISAASVSSQSTRALAGSLDNALGSAFGMGARFGLRMSAHSHELTAQGAIKVAPNILKIRVSSVKQTALPNLSANAENYIWIVDDTGHFIIAPEIQIAARQTLGHPTLCGGCMGRIAGEVEKVIKPDGTIRLVINNQSGRYFNDFVEGKKHLENAAKVLQVLAGPKAEVVAKFLDF